MGVIKGEHARNVTTGAVVLQLGDLEQRGDRLRAASEQRAETIVAEAQAERARTVAGAYEEGHEAGYAAGHAEGHEAGLAKGRAEAVEQRGAELDAIVRAWSVGANVFADARDASARAASVDVLRLAVLFAEKVARRTVGLDPGETARAHLDELIGMMLEPSRISVRVHPGDASVIRESLPALASRLGDDDAVTLREDASLERGSCVLSTPTQAEIDARVQVMLDRLADAVLPAGRVRDQNAPGERPALAVDVGDESPAGAADSADTREAPLRDPGGRDETDGLELSDAHAELESDARTDMQADAQSDEHTGESTGEHTDEQSDGRADDRPEGRAA